MKKVLYFTNIEVPYKVRMFNELAKHCDLTVLYERYESKNRNANWAGSEIMKYKKEYLNGINIGNEYSFSIKMFKYIFKKYDAIIISCYNSPVQMLAIITMKIFNIPYILSTDGEVFCNDKSLKSRIKKFFIKGADEYLAAGEQCTQSLQLLVGKKKIRTYYFSSLTENELKKNAEFALNNKHKRNNTILVVGQYYDYKGMDIAAKVAKMDKQHKYKFVGMGERTNLFKEEQGLKNIDNIEVIPFLKKHELEEEYKNCAMLVLPSRQECWGLVINEAASFGIPIVSTWGSGAAVEFLSDNYSKCLAIPGDEISLYNCISNVFNLNCTEYSKYLIEKSQKYSIEICKNEHIKCLDKMEEK